MKANIQIPKAQQSLQDSTKIKMQNNMLISPGGLIEKNDSKEDSTRIDLSPVPDSLSVVKPQHINTPEIRNLLARENQILAYLMEYDSEYIPLALYDQVWIYKYSLPDSVKMEQVHQEMLSKYPLNQYTYAATLMLQGKEIQVTTNEDVLIEEKYAQAIDMYTSSPDSSKIILKSLTDLKNSPYNDKSKFTLGYLYWFNEHDSLNAKPYFDDLLKKNRDSDYSVYILQFYDGKSFIFTEQLPAIKELEEKEKQKKEAEN
jgi:hypothetical protein